MAKNGDLVRTTLVIPNILDRNLSMCALQLNLKRGELIEKAIKEFIKKHGKGIDPDKEIKGFKPTYE